MYPLLMVVSQESWEQDCKNVSLPLQRTLDIKVGVFCVMSNPSVEIMPPIKSKYTIMYIYICIYK